MAFILFPTLPTELRLKIWHLAKPDPREVCIKYSTRRHELENGKSMSRFAGWKSNEPIPAILHVCHESREVGLTSLRLAFGSSGNGQAFRSFVNEAEVYFDFEKDTLRFGVPSDQIKLRDTPSIYLLPLFLGGHLVANGGEDIKHLSIDVHDDLFDRSNFCFDEIRQIRALQTLDLWYLDGDFEGQTAFTEHVLRAVAVRNPGWIVPTITACYGTERKVLKVDSIPRTWQW